MKKINAILCAILMASTGVQSITAAPIHDAANNGDLERLKRLAQCVATNFNEFDEEGNTPLILAVTHGHHDCVQALVTCGADVNLGRELWMDTPLIKAAGCGHDHIVEFLISRGADPNSQNADRATALICAAEGGHDNCLRILIPFYGTDDKGQALIGAMRKKQDRCVKMLIESGANVNYDDDGEGTTPLIEAAGKGRNDHLEMLIKAGAQVNLCYLDGEYDTPLIAAAYKGYGKCVKTLLDAGANIDFIDQEGKTALMRASKKHNPTHNCVIHILLEYGANTDKVDLQKIIDDNCQGCVNTVLREQNNPGLFRRLKERREEFMKGGGLSMLVALMRDFATPVERNLYEGNIPQAWWKMPFEMSTWSGVEGQEVPVLEDVGEKEWEEKGWGPDAVWCQ